MTDRHSVDWRSVDWRSVDWRSVDWRSVVRHGVDWHGVDRHGVDQHNLALHCGVGPQRGMGTMLVMAVVLVLMMLSGAIGAGGKYLIAGHRAQAAADLAALAGAQSYGTGGDGCGLAKAYGRKNHHTVSRCRVVGDASDFVLTVKVNASASVNVPGLPRKVTAVADAGPVRAGSDG